MSRLLPEKWKIFLQTAGFQKEIWEKPLARSVERRKVNTVFPPENDIFNAFSLTPPDAVKVVLLGQDPYHDDGQAEGLAFSVPPGVALPPSLRNIFKEYSADLECPLPDSGSLRRWAANGVLLLNSILTVDAHSPGSHKNFGWEKFTDAVIRALDRQRSGIVFLLWGSYAQKKRALISPEKHHIICGVHPSPLSAYRGFFGSKPFSRTEKLLPGWHWQD